MKYKQLTFKERYQISYLKGMGIKKKIIAQTLGRHISTIYRELKRNKDRRGYYYPRKAHQFAVARRKDNGKQALVSIVERKTGLALIKRVQRKTAEEVKDAIIELLTPIKYRVKTITSDNGLEFAEHKVIARALDCRYYFAHPYSLWERGSNENLNGLIRQYFPKKMVFDSISDEEIKAVENRLNHRPRKRLKYKTPYEAFY